MALHFPARLKSFFTALMILALPLQPAALASQGPQEAPPTPLVQVSPPKPSSVDIGNHGAANSAVDSSQKGQADGSGGETRRPPALVDSDSEDLGLTDADSLSLDSALKRYMQEQEATDTQRRVLSGITRDGDRLYGVVKRQTSSNSDDTTSDRQPELQQDEDAEAPDAETNDTEGIVIAQASDGSWQITPASALQPESEINLDVPFTPQLPPGTNWKLTHNCGQTSSAMMFDYYGFYNHKPANKDDIIAIDNWLAKKYSDAFKPDYSADTTVTILQTLAREYAGFASSYYENNWTKERLKESLQNNKPVIFATEVYMCEPPEGVKRYGHFMVLRGMKFDAGGNITDVIVNDPGRSLESGRGNNVTYDVAKFENCWGQHNRAVVIVEGAGTGSGACGTPQLNQPDYNQTLPSNVVTFGWNATSCTGQNGYLLRVGTSDGASDVKSDFSVQGIQTNIEFSSQWYNRDLYWAVRANASGAGWSASRKFRIQPNTSPGGGDACSSYVERFDFNPGSPSSATEVTINYKIKTNFPNFRSARLRLPDGALPEAATFERAYVWNTRSTADGDHKVILEIDDNQGSAWDHPETCERSYHLNPRPNPAPNPPVPTGPNDGEVFTEGFPITLSWTATGAEYYGEIWGGPAGTTPFGWQTSTSIGIGPQWAGNRYHWHVKAKNQAGISDYGIERSFTVKLAAPVLVSPQVQSCSQVALSWSDRSGNEEGYRIYRNGAAVGQTGPNIQAFTDTSLSGNTTYGYEVRAFRGDQQSDASNSMSATTSSCVTKPAAPTLTSPASSAVFREGDSVQLCWSATGSEYLGEVWGGPDGTQSFGWQSDTCKTITPKGGYTYSWHVKARNVAGESSWSAETRTFVLIPATPTGLVGQSPSCKQINLTWRDASNSEEGYRVYRKGNLIAQLAADSTSYEDKSVAASSSYDYVVRAYRGSLLSDPSNSVSISTGACPTTDTQPPQVSWVAPVTDEQVYNVDKGMIDLKVSATDNVGVSAVHFQRWDAVHSTTVALGVDYTPPFQMQLDSAILNLEWNEVQAFAVDAAGNWSAQKYIWVYRKTPHPDLAPFAPAGYDAPVVPSATQGDHQAGMLYVDLPSYFKCHVTNGGSAAATTSYDVELWIDDIRVMDYPFGPSAVGAVEGIGWRWTVPTPGWHTVKLIVDPDNVVSELDETNNTWEKAFYWYRTAPYTNDFSAQTTEWSFDGLWHLAGNSSMRGGDHGKSWWYGDEGSLTYDTGGANAAELLSPDIYIPDTGYYLRFNYGYQTETKQPDWDQRRIQLSVDGGDFWDVLQLSDDNMGVWHASPPLDLSAYAGHRVRVRFYFDTKDAQANAFRGWYVDDFAITKVAPPTCSDTTEPNGSAADARSIAFGESVDGIICPNGDIDWFKFNGSAGDQVMLDIDALTRGSTLDAVLVLYDSDGNSVIAENDDESLDQYDPKIVVRLPHAGLYYARVRSYSHPSTGGTDFTYRLTLKRDNAAPTVAFANPSDNSYLDPSSAQITVDASDAETAVRSVIFLWHSGDWGNPDWDVLGEDTTGSDGWTWQLNTTGLAEQQGAALYVFAIDQLGNWSGAAAWDIGIDRTPPTATIAANPMYGDAPFRDLYLTWEGADSLSGPAQYDVQYRVAPNGSWQDLLLDTEYTGSRWVGQVGLTYNFRVRAQDRAGNLGPYSDGSAALSIQNCPTTADDFEGDDTPANARAISTVGALQLHNAHVEGDVDWVKFVAQAGKTYVLTATPDGRHADPVLSLYDTDGVTLLDANDDYDGFELGSRIVWQAPKNGTFFVKVTHWDSYGQGCTTRYGLTVVENNYPPYWPVNPYPTKDATDVSVDTWLGWIGGDPDGDDTTYSVFLGTTPAELVMVCSNLSVRTTTCDPTPTGSLAYAKDYYWLVYSQDSRGAASASRTWHFRTSDLPTVTVDEVSVTGLNDVPITSVQRGQTVKFRIRATNQTAVAQSSQWTWAIYGPDRLEIPSLGLADSPSIMQVGETIQTIQRTIPGDAELGVYQFVGAVTMGANENWRQMAFNVTASDTPTPTPVPTWTPVPGSIVDCPAAPSGLKLDGDLTEWGGRPAIHVDKDTAASSGHTPRPMPADLSGDAYCGWDGNDLVFAGRLSDDVIKRDSTNLWDDDGMELGIDGLSDGFTWGAPSDHQFTIASDGAIMDLGTLTVSGATIATRTGGGGWTYELRLPASVLNMGVLAAGRGIRVNVGLNDDDDGGGRDDWLMWRGSSTNSHSEAFGTLILTGSPSQTPTFTPVPTATFTPVPTATFTPMPTATFTPMPTATFTPVATATNTPGVGTAVVKIVPATKTLTLAGGAVSVELSVENVANLGGFQTELIFDPTILSVSSVSLGRFLGSTGRSVAPVGPTIDNLAGKVSFGAFTFGASAGPSGSGTLASITLAPKSVGTSLLRLQSTGLSDPGGVSLAVTTQNGQVQVTGCFGDFNGDHQVDIFDLQRAASHWNCKAGDGCYDVQYDTEPDGDIDIFDLQRFASVWGAVCQSVAAARPPTSQEQPEAQPGEGLALSLEPAERHVVAGDVFTETVQIHTAANLAAFQSTLRYNAQVLAVDTVTVGPFLGASGRTVIPVGPTIDNTAGSVTFGAFTFGAQGGVSGDGAVFFIRLRAKGIGESELTFEQPAISDPQGNPLTLGTASNGIVHVGAAENQASITPALQRVAPGDVFTETLRLDGATGVGAFQVTLSFDPTILNLEAASLGTFLSSTGRTVVPVGPTIHNDIGQASFGGFTFGSQPGALGGGPLALFRFRALAPGMSKIDVQELGLSNPSGNPLPSGGSIGAEVRVGSSRVYLPLLMR